MKDRREFRFGFLGFRINKMLLNKTAARCHWDTIFCAMFFTAPFLLCVALACGTPVLINTTPKELMILFFKHFPRLPNTVKTQNKSIVFSLDFLIIRFQNHSELGESFGFGAANRCCIK